MERGLISRKNRGFCARVEALTGIWIWLTRAGSVLDRGSRIGRLGFNQRGEAAAQSAGGACPRRGFAGVEKSGAPGAYSDRGLAVEHPLGMRNPPVRSGQWIGARGVVLDGDGGVERRNITGVRCAGN